MTDFTKKEIGDFGEKSCVKYLRKNGYKILSQNSRLGHLETDIIATNKDFVCFVEVKTRREDKNNISRPSSAVNYDKRTNLIKFAYAFCKSLPKKLKDKILTYSVPKEKDEDGIEYVDIRFYTKEASDMIWQLLSTTDRVNEDIDYYSILLKNKEEQKKK